LIKSVSPDLKIIQLKMQLSSRDLSVLSTVFDCPNGIFPDTEVEDNLLGLENRMLKNDSEKMASLKNAEAVRLAEEGRHEEALRLLDDLISTGSTLPSIYNNRAQVKKLIPWIY
jgi:hypothetical protein